MINSLRGARKLQLILLDACRDNPFAKSMKRTRGVPTKGLAPFAVPDDGNVIVVYAAEPGRTALDKDPANPKDSPFSVALSKYLTAPDMEITKALGAVRDYVVNSTRKDQKPYQNMSVGQDPIYLGPHQQQPDAGSLGSPIDSDDVRARGLRQGQRRRLGRGVGGFPANAYVGFILGIGQDPA